MDYQRKVTLWDRLTQRVDELSEALRGDAFVDQLERAGELIEQRDLVEASAILNKILIEQEDHAVATHLLGVVRMSQNQLDEAIALFERALEMRANLTAAMLALGQAYFRSGRRRDAERSFQEVLANGDDSATAAHLGLGRVFAEDGEFGKAMRELRKSLAATPGDPEAATALAELVLEHAHADPKDAIEHLARACEKEVPPESLVALARMQLRVGKDSLARQSLAHALQLGPEPATLAATHSALAELAVRRGDLLRARQEIDHALVADPGPAFYEQLGDILTAQGDFKSALQSFADARGLGGRADEKLLLAALRAGRPLAGLNIAKEVLDGAGAASVAALTVCAACDHEQGDLLARALAESAPTDAAGFEARLLAAAHSLEDNHEQALAWLRELLDEQPQNERATQSLKMALARVFTDAQPATDLYGLANRVHAATLAHPSLGEFSQAAARNVDAFDQPLLVAVMGEFSSGKSSFVNAFLGDSVLPVGITPTTATINVLKYGRTRSARIVYRNETTKSVIWSDVADVLRGVDKDEAERIKWVEIMYPSDILQRVNFVDTPGLNSILPEHEATAKHFVSQADAVVWLFSAAQAGKASEREALDDIVAQDKRVVGVINKVDRVEQGQRSVLEKRLRDELGGVLEGLASTSAQQALAAMRTDDANGLAESGWKELLRVLEETLFSRAPQIKHQSCHRRLGLLLDAATAKLRPLCDAKADESKRLAKVGDELRSRAHNAQTQIETSESKQVQQRFSRAYREAAREVLELVRPRSLPFGSHRASPADRDYLFGLLEQSIRAAVTPLAGTVHDLLHDGLPDADAHAAAGSTMALLNAQHFDKFVAYARGHLRGGYIDDFFVRVLPKLELTEDTVYHSLVRDAPDVSRELIEPLAQAVFQAMTALSDNLNNRAAIASVALIELEHGILAALTQLAHDHQRLTPDDS